MAFLGTDRTGLGQASPEEWSKLGLSAKGDPPEVLLKAAVLLSTQKRAGKKHALVQRPSFVLQKTKEQLLSSRAALFLESILEGSFGPALQEFLDLSRRQNKKLPNYLIPELMALVEKRELPWEALAPVLSKTSLSFLRLHPQWRQFAREPVPGDWESTNLEKRKAYLRFLRQVNPAEALQQLKDSWEEEAAKDKVAFLQILQENPLPQDEPFLEQWLEDKSKKVQEQAALLLLQLPESALSIRLYDYVFQHIEEKDEAPLKVHLPEEEDPFWSSLGLQQKKGRHDYQSRGAYLLGQLMSLLHPSYWNTFFNLPPEDCLKIIEAAGQRDLLQKGIVGASLFHEEQEWIDAIAHRLFMEKSRGKENYVEVLEKISAAAFNELLARQLKNQPFMEEKSLAFSAIQLCDHPWEDRLSQAIILPFQQLLASARSAQWQLFHYKTVLQIAAYRVNPHLLESLKNGWQFQSHISFHWQEDIEKFNKTLHFRKGMRKALLEE